MKRIVVLIVAASGWSICAFAQAPRPLQVGIGTGWAVPPGYHAKPGPLFYLEPTYRMSNNFTVGLRTEYMMMQRGLNEPYIYASPFSTSLRASGSATVSGQYCFSNGAVFAIGSDGGDAKQIERFARFRPFIGAGAGVFFLTPYTQIINTVTEQFLNCTQHEVSGGPKFGCYPKVGFMTGRLTFTAQYNLVVGKSTDTYTNLTNAYGVISTWTVTNTVNNNYMSFMVGYLL